MAPNRSLLGRQSQKQKEIFQQRAQGIDKTWFCESVEDTFALAGVVAVVLLVGWFSATLAHWLLALQLRIVSISESMGHHDSEIMDDRSID
jgi:hypothetical protein